MITSLFYNLRNPVFDQNFHHCKLKYRYSEPDRHRTNKRTENILSNIWFFLLIQISYFRLLSFTKPPLLQESKLTGSGSPNLVDLVEDPVKWKMEALNLFYPWLSISVVQLTNLN